MHSGNDINDLLTDPSFRNWVLAQDLEAGLYWERWMMQHPDKKELVEQARIMLQSLQFNESSLTERESYQLLQRIKDTNASGEKRREAIVRPINQRVKKLQNQQKNKKSTWPYLFRYAAVLAGALIFSLAVHLTPGYWESEQDIRLVEKINEKGQKATIFLPDGSMVRLNSSSSLRYPKAFTADTREVYLKGEAFFDVKRSSKPFIVHAANLKTKVLGTSFNVRAYPATEAPSVALVRGKVMLSSAAAEQELLLLPGEKGSINKEGGQLIKMAFNYEEEAGWKEGIMTLKDMPLKKALSRIEEWYGVEFITEHMPRQDKYVTGRFENETLEHVLQSIGYAIKFNHRIEGNKVYLKFNK